MRASPAGGVGLQRASQVAAGALRNATCPRKRACLICLKPKFHASQTATTRQSHPPRPKAHRTSASTSSSTPPSPSPLPAPMLLLCTARVLISARDTRCQQHIGLTAPRESVVRSALGRARQRSSARVARQSSLLRKQHQSTDNPRARTTDLVSNRHV